MVHMRVPKDQVQVKIKTESAIINGIVHTLVNGRLSDYMTSQKGKFLPVTDAEVYYLDSPKKDVAENGVKREIVFVNTEKIEMIEYI
jgi:hypothetical protein